MKRVLLLPVIVLLLLARASFGGGEVFTGERWVCGTNTVTVGVDQNSTANAATVTYTDAGGTSAGVTSTNLGPGSSETTPSVTQAPSGSTPNESYRIKDHGAHSKVQYRNDKTGAWVDGKLLKEKKLGDLSCPGQTITGLPVPVPVP